MFNNLVRKLRGQPPGVIRVWCRWDEEASVWYVFDSNLQGIAAEAETLEELGKAVKSMAEDLLECTDNGSSKNRHREVPVELLSRFGSHAHC